MITGCIVIEWYDFQRRKIEWFFNELEEMRKKVKKITGYGFDNSHYFISFDGEEGKFSFSVSSCGSADASTGGVVGDKFSLNLWVHRGQIAIFAANFVSVKGENIPSQIIEEAEKAMRLWSRDGKKKCSDCEDLIIYEKNKGHRYFGGVYCSDCWIGDKGKYKGNGGWYEREKRETYN